MEKITALSAIEQAQLIREKKLSAVELLDATYEHVQKVDGRPGSIEPYTERVGDADAVHAFIILTPEHAYAKAKEVDRKIAAGEVIGALAGVPYSAKDVYCTHGIQTTAASRILDGWKPPYDAAVIEKLDQADAVMFGKVNLDEFTFGGSNETSAYQPSTRNPWNLGTVPGGSSGGSAAAVAAEEGAFSLGTDTGGSIRGPASFCGTVGMKPTYGRISRWGTIPFASSMDTMGPITRTVADCALITREMAGFDPRDNVTRQAVVENYLAELQKGVKGMKIGISMDYLQLTYVNDKGEYDSAPIDSEISAKVYEALDIYRALGAEIVENVPMSNTKYGIPAYFVITRIEAYSNLQRFDGLKFGHSTSQEVEDMYDLYRKSRGEGFGYQSKLRLLTGMFASQDRYYEKYYRRAMSARTMMRRDFEEAFDPNGAYKLDILLTPTNPCVAFPFGGATATDSLVMQLADQFTAPMNFSGTPGISFPSGFNQNGMPIGLQAAGYDYQESKILRAAYAYEQATMSADWRKAKPTILNNK